MSKSLNAVELTGCVKIGTRYYGPEDSPLDVEDDVLKAIVEAGLGVDITAEVAQATEARDDAAKPGEKDNPGEKEKPGVERSGKADSTAGNSGAQKRNG